MSLIHLTSRSYAFAAGDNQGTIGTLVVPTSTGRLVVLGVSDGSPAARKGIRPGDLIVEVNDVDLTGSDFSQVVKKYLWGAEGTEVVLKLLRPGREGVISLRLSRAEITEKVFELPGVRMIRPE